MTPSVTDSPRPAPSFPPPTGPRLDGGPRPHAAPGPAPIVRPAAAPRSPTVDWWAWQARVRGTVGTGPPVVSAPRRPHAARTTGVVVLVAVLAAAGVVAVAGLAGADRPDRARTTTAVDAVADARPVPVTAMSLALVGVSDLPPVVTAPPPGAVGAGSAGGAGSPVVRTTVDFVDPTRPPVPRGDAATAAGRLLRTEIRAPAPSALSGLSAAGPFPLVVFAHGYATSTAAYAPLLDALAARGYVVAAPELPETSTALDGDPGPRDPSAQVADLAFVVSAVSRLAEPGGPLAGLVGDGPVGVVGHSDGGVSAAAAAFSSRARDPRIGAAVVLSGARIDDGDPWFPVGGPALLAVHGDADGVNPFASSQELFTEDGSGGLRMLVRVRGGGHTDAFLDARSRPAVVGLIDDFLRSALAGDAAATARLAADGAAPGVLDLVGFAP